MKIAIIGNGISGITCARWLRKQSDCEITVISDETDHFYSRTALMYVYMGHMRPEDVKPYEDWFWEKNRIGLVKERITEIDYQKRMLKTQSAKSIGYDKLVFALGSKPNKFGWPGQDLTGVGGLYHWQDLETMEAHSKDLKRAVIVGGGLIGIEMAEMFRSRGIEVTMLVREDGYWNNVLPAEESAMITQHIKDHHIDLRLGVNLGEIKDDGTGKACGVVIKETGEEIECGFVGLTAGVSPNISFVKDGVLECGRGIKVDAHLQTNIEGVFAIGDCAELKSPKTGRRSIEAVWYTGRMMGETVAHNILGKQIAYDPGIWFNSAKFLDLEYQVYGSVPNKPDPTHASLFWQSKSEEKSIRINYDNKSGKVLGFNLIGIRYRHEVCEKWLSNGTSIQEVLTHLSLANFDPEFCKEYEQDLLDVYNKQTGSKLTLKKKRKLDQVISFLRGSKIQA